MSKGKKVGIIIGSIVLVLLIVFILIVYLYNPIKIKSDEFKVELGENIPTDAEFYIEGDSNDVKVDIISDKSDLVKDKDCRKVGTYKVKLNKDFFWANKEEEVLVKIEDTKKPEITEIPDLDLFVGEEMDFAEKIIASDLAGIESIDVDKTTYDLSKAGSYKVKVVVKDNSGNEASKTFNLEVKDKPKPKKKLKYSKSNPNPNPKPIYVDGEPWYPCPWSIEE